MRYLLTFACCGQRLHGTELGSVDRHHNLTGSPLVEDNPDRLISERHFMSQPPYVLNNQLRRSTVLAAIQEHCSHVGWLLLAAHVRTTHVHLILEARTKPVRIMSSLKILR